MTLHYSAATNSLRITTGNDAANQGPGRFARYYFPADFNPLQAGSLNGILNNEHGTSPSITAIPFAPQTFTTGSSLSHQDEAVYLHMSPSPNSTISCMHPAGARDIVRRIPLGAPYPDQNHHDLMAHDADFLNFSRMQLQKLKFTLRFSDGTILPARGHTSFLFFLRSWNRK